MTSEQLRCDGCGKFVAYADLVSGIATQEILSAPTECSDEEYQTLCKICNEKDKNNAS